MDKTKLALEINKVRVTEDGIHLQLKNIDGLKVEATLAFFADPFNGAFNSQLDVNAVRHFTDPESVPWFEDSMTWPQFDQEVGIR